VTSAESFSPRAEAVVLGEGEKRALLVTLRVRAFTKDTHHLGFFQIPRAPYGCDMRHECCEKHKAQLLVGQKCPSAVWQREFSMRGCKSNCFFPLEQRDLNCTGEPLLGGVSPADEMIAPANSWQANDPLQCSIK
jgi:hypothetical protein